MREGMRERMRERDSGDREEENERQKGRFLKVEGGILHIIA